MYEFLSNLELKKNPPDLNIFDSLSDVQRGNGLPNSEMGWGE